jgi:hypothetical protein
MIVKFLLFLIISILSIIFISKLYIFIDNFSEIINENNSNIISLEKKLDYLLDNNTIDQFKSVISKLYIILNKNNS